LFATKKWLIPRNIVVLKLLRELDTGGCTQALIANHAAIAVIEISKVNATT
jgi:hypothetical protein